MPDFDVDNMDLQQLDAALRASIEGVTPQQLLAVHEFIQRIGGADNARAALQMLSELESRAG